VQYKVEHLGFLVTRDGIKPQQKKVQGILDIKEPASTKQVRSFVGMINNYKSMWPSRSQIVAPLTALTGKGVSFVWEDIHRDAFQATKTMVAQDTLLAHLD